MNRIALVVGSTGLIGQHLLEKLSKNSNYSQIIALTRKPLNTQHSKVKEIIVDFEQLDAVKIDNTIDDAFCCLGTTMRKAGSKEAFYKVDFTYCVNFGKLALQNGAKNFQIISSMGASASSPFYYNKVKGQTEDELANMNFSTLNIFRPSLLLGERTEKRIGEDLGKVLNQIFAPLIPKKYKGIEGKKVADFMMKKALESDQSGTRVFTSDKMQ
ncbi:oxidoreductase [Flammeovirga aprica]|uniref:Oxidoreductase n=1 Tax=Flammeovirga aprica JL-4 TaxID=694437 RepID=A0A7X9XDB5_9BACT|nr:oxidoreductase [Flammeovirga aprica]NME72625.1 oxidoreductase [Flammeovirga aprica JL-4]